MSNGHRTDKRRRLLFRWGALSLLCTLAAAVAVATVGRTTGEAVPAAGANVEGLTSVLTRGAGDAATPLRFEDVTRSMGVDFRHMPAPRQSLLPEDMGSGVACGDYDSDGYPDLFFVNFSGSAFPGATLNDREGRSRLLRNIRGQRFEDVTDEAGVGFVGHGMGAAWGDYDNDGDLDLYVTAFGDNVLYENLGNGAFHDVTAEAGVNDPRFSAGASWGDYDRDGDLDLYVCNYVEFVYREADRDVRQRQYATEQPYTLNPSSYPPQPNALFRNNGPGAKPRFENVSSAAGVADPDGRSLSASWVDFDNDGWPDLYVANDVSKNGVFRNRGDGTFEDVGASSLAADYRGAMGIAVSDFDNDHDQDLFITHWLAQENALYCNMLRHPALGDAPDGRALFMDDAEVHGLGQIALDAVGWATGFCDFDNDGRRDLWVLNGSTLENSADHRLLEPQKAFLFWNRGTDGFVDIAPLAGPALAAPMVARGGARLDFDRDGLPDLVVVQLGGPALILHNVSPGGGNWLRVSLAQTGGNSFAVGARVYATAGALSQMEEVGSSSSYLSQDEAVVHFGLGTAKVIDELRIVWPDGAQEIHTGVGVNAELAFHHTARYPIAAQH